MFKAMLMTIFAGAMIFGTAGAIEQPVPAAAAAAFKDVSVSHWAYKAINDAVSKGYLKGDGSGKFRPNDPVTRAEFAAILARVSTNENAGGAAAFSDLAGHWSEKEVSEAAGKGFFSPADYTNGFKPGTPLTRVEMAKWMASGLAARDGEYKQAIEDTKDTIVPVTEYYKGGLNKADYPYVSVMLGTGLMSGYPDDSFGGGKTTTRAEVAVIIQRYETTQTKAPSAFKGLNELREVGTTGTNHLSVTSYVDPPNEHTLQSILNKNTSLRNGAGKIKIHHYIFLGGTSAKQPGSIYGRMFADKETLFLDDSYLVFIDSSVSPLTDSFSLAHYSNGMTSFLQGGIRVYGQGPTKFGYKTLPNDGSKFFVKGKETRFWSYSVVPRYVTHGDSVIRDIGADDGSMGIIVLKK
ncbi:S-layer homology domain-containing protein [Paenibacillus sp. PSB04]|uniref:S-layer homology domain-containing protein n=1 Tax=Paenibacillus sp. PSB04 TaxID=2866810 RepID=UPI0021F1E95B|nr:S-layer homology domain-containing protein [Paenibacillus sp. PSB04]UYO04438.1 S-layer homology domain-containing protein [Paenibacillus sp. PSB04]